MKKMKDDIKIISRMIGRTVRFSSGNTGKVMEVRQSPDDCGPTYTVAMPNGELCSVYYNRVTLNKEEKIHRTEIEKLQAEVKRWKEIAQR
jgi:hypothetical protein